MSDTTTNTPVQPAPASTAYEPGSVESHWYGVWEKAGYFQPATDGKPYVIVIPPPNVTGSLHMGHALNMTIQDVLARYHRMRGYATLWVPGVDHGGIATQNVVEKLLHREKLTRYDLGREKFLERMWAWRKEAGDNILNQSRRLGASLDWSRTRFTMDEQCSRAVRHAFVELYNRKLLYRGKRLVNWCPRCATALADIEVEHKQSNGSLWHIRYPITERRKAPRSGAKKGKANPFYEQGYIIVATTRPETLLGDTGVAVSPKDKRYKDLVGAQLRLPLTNRSIPIVADSAVDATFGSGAVKVTPAHDPTDFEIAERAKLPHITVIGFDGKMTEDAGASYAGLDRFEARKKVVEDLEANGLLDKVEPYALSLSVCYRCDSVIEPLESEQWFLSMANMAKKARDANKKGKVKIVPESWESPFQLWLRNLKDWCVSRQIWWGHRIPVWYCATEKCPPVVSTEDPTICPTCKRGELTQDPDVLDTWFSSALWPFSVMGWPDATPDLKRFFPTSTLVTGHEILYLWVARMVMFGLEFLGKSPFEHVLIHGIVRDKQGRKMSKSLGNVIDPLELIQEFGADAVRFSLAQSAAPGRDMQISKENFVSARNFCNKIWNATRFVLMNLGDMKAISPVSPDMPGLELADRWILHRYNQSTTEATASLERFDVDTAARTLYDFFWGDYCDWYLEIAKPRVDRVHFAELPCSPESTHVAKNVLATVLEGTLRMMHPFLPFISEELWARVPKSPAGVSAHAMSSSWPDPNQKWADLDAARRMAVFQEVVTKLRNIRSEMGIGPGKPIRARINTSAAQTEQLLKSSEAQIALRTLNCRVEHIEFDASSSRPAGSAAAVVPGAQLFVPLSGLIDFAKEKMRLEKELLTIRQDAERLNKKMANDDFRSHAPAEEIDKVKARLEEAAGRIRHLEQNISALN
jgi:valyl-tRNA synthetase